MTLDVKQEIDQLVKEKVKLDGYITAEQRKLKEQLQTSKEQLRHVNKKLRQLQKAHAQQQWKDWMLTDVTVQDLYKRVEELKQTQPTAYSVILHSTPLTQSNKTFYRLTQNTKVLRNTYSLVIDIRDGEVVIANLFKIPKDHPYDVPTTIACYYHSLDFSAAQNEKALENVFTQYVQLRNKNKNRNKSKKGKLIPIKEFFEDRKLSLSTQISKYLDVIRQKDDTDLLEEFAINNNLYTNDYQCSLDCLSKEQLHQLAMSIRKNKEQLFRWMIADPCSTFNARPTKQFDMTSIFKVFKKYDVDIKIVNQDFHGNIIYYNITLDGRRYKV